ncbi:hypothetical protein E2C01_046473 [Portunus trituberculatus]|uniref:Uncharacterized protein n=1 Tax=Portunus trituberculatus TaxID=210409 RepID=A0A5B7FYI9_PORTR|nr:hypothetical protein [Portunus trituberculatus]
MIPPFTAITASYQRLATAPPLPADRRYALSCPLLGVPLQDCMLQTMSRRCLAFLTCACLGGGGGSAAEWWCCSPTTSSPSPCSTTRKLLMNQRVTFPTLFTLRITEEDSHIELDI